MHEPMHEAPHAAPTTFIGKYIFSFDHKVIGIQYLLTAILMAVVGGLLSLMIRLQLQHPEMQLLGPPEAYLAWVTMHGTIMVFFVVSLAISGFANFLIPLQLGARDMAYPMLNMLSYWTIVPSVLLMLASFFVPGGAAAAGWTMYPPLSAVPEAVPGSGLGTTFWLLGMALFIASFTMGGLNFLTTIVNCRTKGMTMWRMPIAVWGFFIATVLGLLAFPPLTAAALMLLFDRHGGTSFFVTEMVVNDQVLLPGAEGTPLLFQHLFWFLGHPEVYVLVLPCVLMTMEIIPVFTRRPMFGYRPSVWALFVIGFLSMIVWGHHMFVTGMNPYIGEYFSIATVIITAPFAILGVNLLASLWRAKIKPAVPMLFALAVISAVGFGGFGGLFLGTVVSDIYFHETYFVVGHFHLMIGTVTLLSLFGALYFWYPKMFGRRMSEKLGRIHFWFTAVPMITIFILMHMQGLGGMLRRTYDPGAYDYNAGANMMLRFPITAMAFILFLAQFVFFWNFFRSLKNGEEVGENPWDATTLEWTTPSPAGHGNWPGALPVVEHDPYEYDGDDFTPQGRVVETASEEGGNA
ncbi:MAG: cbb3-type cytochrome c oxidase subunit I [Planctomycetota bacterium]